MLDLFAQQIAEFLVRLGKDQVLVPDNVHDRGWRYHQVVVGRQIHELFVLKDGSFGKIPGPVVFPGQPDGKNILAGLGVEVELKDFVPKVLVHGVGLVDWRPFVE